MTITERPLIIYPLRTMIQWIISHFRGILFTMNSNKGALLGMGNLYNSNSIPQLNSIQSSIPFLKQAIELLNIDY